MSSGTIRTQSESSTLNTPSNSINNNSTNPSNLAMLNQSSATSAIANAATNQSSGFLNMINKNNRSGSMISNTTNNETQPANAQSQSETVDANSGNSSTLNSNQKDPDAQSSASSQSNTLFGNLSQSQQAATNTKTASTNIPIAYTFDPWAECLAIFFSYEFIYTKCPQARVDAWPFIYTRLQQLLPFVDPNEPHEMPRTSLLFGGGANSLEKIRRAANERDANLNLWKNYLIGACCLTSGTDRYIYYGDYEKPLLKSEVTSEGNSMRKTTSSSMTTAQSQANQNSTGGVSQNLSTTLPNNISTSSAINVDFTITESTSKFYATFGTATSLLKMIVPFIRCECNYFREIIIRGLGRINIEAIRDLVEELLPMIKECIDKRQEKLRRMKKRDLIRLTIVRIFELMAEQRTLGKRLIDTMQRPTHQLYAELHQQIQQQHQANEQAFFKSFADYVDGIQVYLDQESEKYSDLTVQIRLHFSMFLHKLIDSVAAEKRAQLFTGTSRCNLFFLCDKWSGRFSLMQHQHLPSQTSSQQPATTGLLSFPR